MEIVTRAVKNHLSRVAVVSSGKLHSYDNVLSSSELIRSNVSRIINKASPTANVPPRVGLYAVRVAFDWASFKESLFVMANPIACRPQVPNIWPERWRYGRQAA
jgi:hypothetical protein